MEGRTMKGNRRVILVADTRCSNSCSFCYYKGRETLSETGTDLLLDIVGVVDVVAIGLNPGHYHNDLIVLKEAVRRKLDIVVTTCPDPEILASLPGKGIGVLSITYSPGNVDKDTVKFLLGKRDRNTKLVLSVVDGTLDLARGMHKDWHRLLNEFDAIYYLMEKGHPDRGWRMTSHLKRRYYSGAVMLARGVPIPLQIDECVRGPGNCLNTGGSEGWLEIDSSGGLRACPYNIEPRYVIESAEELAKDQFPGTSYLNARSPYSLTECSPKLEYERGEEEWQV